MSEDEYDTAPGWEVRGGFSRTYHEPGTVQNVCENGDHPAPAGQRFCSRKCQREDASGPEDGVKRNE